MRSFVALLALGLALSACSLDPCSQQAKAAFAVGGGPVGMLVAMFEQCSPPPAGQVAESPPDLAPAPDLAEPDLARPPVIWQQPPPDMSSPLDLAPPCPTSVEAMFTVGNNHWQVLHATAIGGPTYSVAPAFDFAAGKVVEGTFDLAMSVVALTCGSDTTCGCIYKAKQINLSKYRIDVASAAWANTNCTSGAGLPGYLVQQGTYQTCVQGRYEAGVMVDGNLAAAGWPNGYMPSGISATLPAGQTISLTTSSQVSLHIGFAGSVVVSGITAAAHAELVY